MNIQIKWRTKDQDWSAAKMFPVEDILDRSRNHAIDLFSRDIFYVIKQGLDIIISNDTAIRAMYHKKRFKVFTMDKIERSDKTLREAGFV